jgi:predicted phage terminase large subunit-like protein
VTTEVRAPRPLTRKKTTPDAETRDGIRWLAQHDLYVLCKNILGYRDMTDGFHKPLCQFSQTTAFAKNLYMVQRGGLKTSVKTIGHNIQRIMRDAETRILLASNKAENSEAILAEIKGHLTANDRLLWLFPDVLHDDVRKYEQWTNSRISVKRRLRRKEATLTTIGLHGELVGQHYDHGTFDDLVGLENSQTREERQRTIEWWKAAQSLLDPGATEDVIGTPWDFDDLYAYLLDMRAKQGLALGVWKVPCWVAADSPGDGAEDVPPHGLVRPTFPERFPISELLRIRREAGSTRFAAQYLLEPVDEETAVFPRSKAIVRPAATRPDPTTLWVVATVDPAISQKGWADYTAHAVVGFDHENRMHVFHLQRGRWPESRVLDEVYRQYARLPMTRAIGVEAIGFQKMFFHLFQREAETRGQYLPLTKLERDTKITKNTRIRVLEPLWNAGHVVLYDDLPALEEFLDEAARFRLTKESTHDDMLDALADCLQLRVRPQAPDPIQDRLADLDPADHDRASFEVMAHEARKAEGAAPLDRRSLRAAHAIHQRAQQYEEARQMEVVGFGEGW